MVLKLNNSMSHSLLEVSRKDLVLKTRTQSKTRFRKRLNYQVSNFRGVDLQQLFENDYFVFNTPIKDYVCTIAFPGVFSSLKNVIKSTNGDPRRINLQMVIKALRIAFDATDDVKVNCTCPDFYYRYSYVATQNGYKYGPPQEIPAPITNPDDNIGSTCKHLSLLLSNKRWLTKAASVVNAFIKAYPDKAALYLYDEDEILSTEDSEEVVSPEDSEQDSAETNSEDRQNTEDSSEDRDDKVSQEDKEDNGEESQGD